MTREEAIKIFNEVLLFGKAQCTQAEFQELAKMSIKALEQEPTTKNDLAFIHTEGLDEGIRCAMCTNSMKSDTGCDGGCVVNNAMYKKVIDVIENHIGDTDKMVEPTPKNDLGVDCISRADARSLICKIDLKHQTFGMSRKVFKDLYNGIDKLPSVTPQEPQSFNWCTDCKEYDQEKHCCHRWSKVIRDTVEEIRQEPKTGHWIDTKENSTNTRDQIIHEVICSECNGIAYFRSMGNKYIGANICPNCGADMREVVEE